MTRWLAWVCVVLLAAGCDEDKEPEAAVIAAAEESEPAAVSAQSARRQKDLLEDLPQCSIQHRGLLLDVGSEAEKPRRAFAIGPFDDVRATERLGVTLGRVYSKKLLYDFWLLEDRKDIVVSLRAAGGTSRRMSVYLDDRRLGTVRLDLDDARVVALPPVSKLEAGRHVLTLRPIGSRDTTRPLIELDWIHIGMKGDDPSRYAAPTLDDVVADVVLADQPRRAIVLRSPGAVRCSVPAAPGTELSLWLGLWGQGSGTAEIRLLSDDDQPVKLKELKLEGGAEAAWREVRVGLGEDPARVAAVEFRAVAGRGSGRIAFAEPKLSVDAPLRQPVKARTVVVVLAAGLTRRLVPPWGAIDGLPGLARLARDGTAFDSYRAPTSVASGVIASLLTGIAPRAHTVEDPLAELPPDIRTLPELLKEASAQTAMFTGVPTSFAAFGVDRAWDKFEQFSPVRDIAAQEPIVRATNWLKARFEQGDENPLLVLAHVRGAHPPWDLTSEEASALPPEEYTGALEPRRGATTLSNLRTSRRRRSPSLAAADWERLRALSSHAIRKQDVAFAQLLSLLERHGRYQDALVLYLGDVAAGDPPEVPFGPIAPLDEDRLAVPLLIKLPGPRSPHRRVTVPITTVDVTRTILDAFGVSTDGSRQSLAEAATDYRPPQGVPQIATLGNLYSTRWGRWLLRGELRQPPSLCRLDIDPACTGDVFDSNPIAANALWQKTFAAVSEADEQRARVKRMSATVDSETQAALRVFGY